MDVCIYCPPIKPGCMHFIAHLLYLDVCIYFPIIPGCMHLLPTIIPGCLHSLPTYYILMYALSCPPIMMCIYCPPIIPGCTFIAHILYLDVCIYCPPILPGCMHLLPTYCQYVLSTCFASIYSPPTEPWFTAYLLRQSLDLVPTCSASAWIWFPPVVLVPGFCAQL
jgi:hypothetical protein